MADFEAGSYNISLFLNTKFGRVSDKEGNFIGGMAANNPNLIDRDGKGAYYMFQYYPTITGVSPAIGSLGGGQLITITGGGFSNAEAKITVEVGGMPCNVVASTWEEITCRTSPYNNSLPATFVLPDGSAAGTTTVAAAAADKQGTWATEGNYLVSSTSSSNWLSFLPTLPAWAKYDVQLEFPDATSPGVADCVGNSKAGRIQGAIRTSSGYESVNVSIAVQNARSVSLGVFSFSDVAGSGLVTISLHDGRAGNLAGSACLAVAALKYVYSAAHSAEACTDPLALNAGGLAPCVFDGGRGVMAQSWTSVKAEHRNKTKWFADTQLSYGMNKTCTQPRASASGNSGSTSRPSGTMM